MMNEPVLPQISAVLAVVVAGYVRGYGGFGFSMITVAALALVLPPDRIVPVVLMLEVAASLVLLPGAWRSVDWSVLGRLLLGVAAGTPVGVWLLSSVPPTPMKMAVAMVIFTLALMLRQGFALRQRPGWPTIATAGVASGILNGAAAIGGPPAVLFFFSSPAGATVSRASLIAFFLVTDMLAAGSCVLAGLLTVAHAENAMILALPMAVGLVVGKRAFKRTPEALFRRRVLLVLMLLSLVTVARAAVEWV